MRERHPTSILFEINEFSFPRNHLVIAFVSSDGVFKLGIIKQKTESEHCYILGKKISAAKTAPLKIFLSHGDLLFQNQPQNLLK